MFVVMVVLVLLLLLLLFVSNVFLVFLGGSTGKKTCFRIRQVSHCPQSWDSTDKATAKPIL